MNFSKDKIVSKSFSKKLIGGLDDFEVRDFLHVLAEEISHLHKKSEILQKQIKDKEDLIRDYRDREHILKEAIASAEKWAEKIRKDAEKNSALVLEKAHNKSESLIQEARHSLQSVYTDIMDLKRMQLQFKTGLKAALQVQMDLLEQDPIFSSSSSLPETNMKTFIEENDSSKDETNVSSLKSSTPSEEKNSDNKESAKEKTSASENLSPVEKDIRSLRESLKSLNKNFS